MSKTILVTGAAGFIGSHVVQSLLARGDSVIALDNFNDYYSPERKHANLAEVSRSCADGGRLRVVEGDIRDRSAALFARQPINAVVHLAAMAGVRASTADPHLYYDVNLAGTLNLLESARKYSVGNFVFASTSSVYGNTQQLPFIETDPCDRPLAPYAASKRAAEQLGFTFHHLYGLNFIALRFFTVYGPRNRPDMMAYKVVDNIFFQREAPLYNNGRMRRDWTFVDDIVAGITAAVDRPLGYEIINLGRGHAILLSDFVRLIEKLAGREANLVPAPMPETDVPTTFADVSKAARLLGYHPKTSVEAGVTAFWKWYEEAVLDLETQTAT